MKRIQMTQYNNYVSLDLETTGLDARTCDIIEVAMIKVRDGEIVDRFESFVFTPLEISDHVSYLTGISAQDLEGAPDFIDLQEKVKAFIGDDALVGHNIWFDWNFLMEKGVDLENTPLWDTYIMSNILYPELPSHSLETNTKYFDIAHEDSHRAMADVMACHELWKILMDTFPAIYTDMRQKIKDLKEKSSWPMLDFFLQELSENKHPLHIPETSAYHPQPEDKIALPDKHTFLHCRGKEPVDIALSLQNSPKTLYIAGYEHTRNKLHVAFPDAVQLQAPFSYLSAQKLEQLFQKPTLDDAETSFLLKTILHPQATSKEELNLSHPERKVWKGIQTEAKEVQLPENAYVLSRQHSLNAQKAICSHYHIFADLDYVEHFDRVVILEPQLVEDNATKAFGRTLGLEQWMGQSEAKQWQKQGEFFFAQLDALGNQLVPSAQYPEHLSLSDMITESNEYIRLRSAISDIVQSTEDEELLTYLKYFQAFFNVGDSSWVRWITVDPRRGTRLNIAPLSIKSLLQKHLFNKVSTVIVSDTAEQFAYFPEMEYQDFSKPLGFTITLPDLNDITGTRKEGDHQALMSYLAEVLPSFSGKTGVIFSSKTALKRYFFDLAKIIPEDIAMLGEDISGGTGKLRDRYVSSEKKKKVIFMSYRNMRSYPTEVLDFDNIILQSLPFDPPGLPIHQARSSQTSNSFLEYAVPRTQLNLLEIVSNFSKKDLQKQLIILDRRAQEKDYGEQLLQKLKE